MDMRLELLDGLARIAYQFRPEKPFLLASGKTSDEYLDCKLALSHAATMRALGAVFLEALDPSIRAIGGLTMGADPIAMSTAQTSAQTAKGLRWFTVRKEPKSHGQKKLIEGDVEPGERVAIVDDVVTSGQSTIQAIRAAKEYGLEIVQVTVLVDRQQLSGMQNIRDAVGSSVSVSAIFTKEEIKSRWTQINQVPETFRATA